MSYLNLEYYRPKEDCLYCDGEDERKIFNQVKSGNIALDCRSSWVEFYHLSPMRENILSWYPFLEKCSVLEIGAGCGAITGLLIRKAKKVTACELTRQRAEIIKSRYDSENLEIIVGDINRISANEKYDYVTLIGVLEYAATIWKNESNPFVALLEKAKSFLKPNGKILLAIENRFGLKYFSGAKEDHLGHSFVGINGYEGTNIRTFSINEIEKLVFSAGLKITKRFYPYPDYKFPTEIFTDSSVNKRVPLTGYYPMDSVKNCVFDEMKLYKPFADCKMMQNFANSFLLEISPEDYSKCALFPDYVKISSVRARTKGVYTAIYYGKKSVDKFPLFPEGNSHIRHILQNKWEKGILKNIEFTGSEIKVTCTLQDGKNMQEEMECLLNTGKRREAINLLTDLRDALYDGVSKSIRNNSPEFEAVFGLKIINTSLRWLTAANIDLVPANIFRNSEFWTIIDCEWTFNFPIPAEFVFWRCIWNCPEIASPFENRDSDEVLKFVGIDRETLNIFLSWEMFFENEYVGAHSLPYKAVDFVEPDNLMNDLTRMHENEKEYRREIERLTKNEKEYKNEIERMERSVENLNAQIDSLLTQTNNYEIIVADIKKKIAREDVLLRDTMEKLNITNQLLDIYKDAYNANNN